MKGTNYFECDRCHIRCRVDSEGEQNATPLLVRHCPEGQGIPVLGTVTRFQEWRGGLWVDVRRWIDAA
jgi:hypothetical protein